MFRYIFSHCNIRRSVFFIALCACCILASVFKSTGFLAQPILQLEADVGGDKHLHLIVASLLGFASVWVTYYRKRMVLGVFGLPTIVLYFAVMSDELSQYYLPRREFSLFDMAANVIGVSIGVILYTFLNKIIHRKNTIRIIN